jgi:6-phosphogluconate dehydrogenase
MKEYAAMFFLMSCTDKMSYNIPTEMQTLFFGEDDEMLKKMISEVSEDDIDDMFNNLSESDLDDIYEEEDTLEQILKQSKTKKKKEYIPTLDEILDKISEQGIGSLTQKEKEVLENYSK